MLPGLRRCGVNYLHNVTFHDLKPPKPPHKPTTNPPHPVPVLKSPEPRSSITHPKFQHQKPNTPLKNLPPLKTLCISPSARIRAPSTTYPLVSPPFISTRRRPETVGCNVPAAEPRQYRKRVQRHGLSSEASRKGGCRSPRRATQPSIDRSPLVRVQAAHLTLPPSNTNNPKRRAPSSSFCTRAPSTAIHL